MPAIADQIIEIKKDSRHGGRQDRSAQSVDTGAVVFSFG